VSSRYAHRARPAKRPIITDDEAGPPQVIAFRPQREVLTVQGAVLGQGAAVIGLLLDLVRETAAARFDESRLLEVVCDFAFRTFPTATHLILAVRDDVTGEFCPLIARARSQDEFAIGLSRTIVSRVVDEGVAVLISHAKLSLSRAESVALSGLETAICAPLMNNSGPFGVLQLENLADHLLLAKLPLNLDDFQKRWLVRAIDVDLRERTPEIEIARATSIARRKNIVHPPPATAAAPDLRIDLAQLFQGDLLRDCREAQEGFIHVPAFVALNPDVPLRLRTQSHQRIQSGRRWPGRSGWSPAGASLVDVTACGREQRS